MRILTVVSLAVLILASSQMVGAFAQAADVKGVRGVGIESCAMTADGVLSAKRSSPTVGRGVRYSFYGAHGKWVGEQWTYDGDRQSSESHLLASEGSIQESSVQALRCTYLSEVDSSDCGPSWVVDEGSDIDLAAVLFSRNSVSAQFEAFYNNFFSQKDLQVRDQLYFIQVDAREPVEPIVTGTSAQPLTLYFAKVKPGSHKLSYGTGGWRRTACFTIPTSSEEGPAPSSYRLPNTTSPPHPAL